MKFLLYLRRLFRRRDLEAEMAEEMRFHLEQRTADLAADGLPAAEARLAAQRRFGNLASLQEQARDTFGWGALGHFLSDLRLGFRHLAKSPGFSLLAVVTLALGIGANTSMFSVLNTVMLEPLPYPATHELVRLHRLSPQGARGPLSAADYLDLQASISDYGALGGLIGEDISFAEPGRPAEFTSAARISSGLLPLLGVNPALGRGFLSSEEHLGRHRVVVLSHRCWQNRFGGRADILGLTVRVDGEPHEVVGVLPDAFNDWRHLGWVDVFRPLALRPDESVDRATPRIEVMARRAPGADAAQADQRLAAFGRQLATAHPQENSGTTWQVSPLDTVRLGETGGTSLTMLIGLSGFVLLIACSNLANLLLARTLARAREFAVRGALGASRLQLIRPLIAESLALALAGGAGALFVATWFTHWMRLRSTGDNGEQVPIMLDWTVFGWALGATLLTALIFGLAPALFALRLDLNATLKSGGRNATGGRGHRRLRAFLIIGQFALALVLLTGAALFIRGLDDLNHRRQGWSPDPVITGTFLLPAGTYPDDAAITAFQRLLLERLASLPGVASASLAYAPPFFTWPDTRRLAVEGHAPPEPGREPATLVNGVSPDYFATVGTPLLAGRAFTDRDDARAAPVFIVSESTARSLFGEASPLGRRLALLDGPALVWGEIVGVARDIRSINPDRAAVTHQLYLPLAQAPRAYHELAVRTAGVEPAALVQDIRELMVRLDPDLPVQNLKPANERIARANYQLGVLRDLLAGIAALGLGLASLGIYGIIARTVAQRSGEFAIRLALGAQVGDITRDVLGSGVRLALIGSAFGLVGAYGLFRLLAAGFPNMRLDGATAIGAAGGVLVVVALLASWLPARRAARIDAIAALRAE